MYVPIGGASLWAPVQLHSLHLLYLICSCWFHFMPKLERLDSPNSTHVQKFVLVTMVERQKQCDASLSPVLLLFPLSCSPLPSLLYRTFREMSAAEEQLSLCRELCQDLAEDLKKEGLKVQDNTLVLNCSVVLLNYNLYLMTSCNPSLLNL